MEKEMKYRIISEGQQDGVTLTCKKYKISRTLYYRWLKRYQSLGLDGLGGIRTSKAPANKTQPSTEKVIFNLIRSYPHYGPKALSYLLDEIGYQISESCVYNVMRRHDLSTRQKRQGFATHSVNTFLDQSPDLSSLASGQCWLFWISDLGSTHVLGHLFKYTIFDAKSRIACTRLYKTIDFSNFEDLLTSVAFPIAQSLNLQPSLICFFEDCLLLHTKKHNFLGRFHNTIRDNGFDIHSHIISGHQVQAFKQMRYNYSRYCMKALTSIIASHETLDDCRLGLQQFIRYYNLHQDQTYPDGSYTPVDYHNKLSGTKTILPVWAYIDRLY